MDNPLTMAEFSRLRKAIQQRDRLVAQGLTTSGVDLRISSALSTLKLYLPAQTQLAAVLKDWETSDAVKRSQIIIWLQQNILNDTPSQESPPPLEVPPRPAFVHPPPPPALPSRAGSIISRPTSLSGTPPIPTSARVTPVQALPNANNAYPPREMHTQASLKPPTPPPKERLSNIAHESLVRRHTFAGRPEPLRRSTTLVDSSTSEGYDSSASTSLYPTAFSGFNSSQPGVSSPNNSSATGSTRRFGSQTSQTTPSSHSHTPNPLGRHDSNQHHTLPNSGQPAQTTQPSSDFAHATSQGLFTPGLQGGPSPYNQQLMDTWTKIQAQQAQQSSMLIQQLTQAHQSPTSNFTAQILAAAQQQQAQHQANFLQHLQAQQAASSNNTTQLLANLQQQQQAQTNQMMSILQQQQNAPTLNPNQNSQSNQQMLDLLSQMQSGGTPGVDWASLASGSGMDPSTLMSMVMGGFDPTNLAMQGAGFMLG
ncbi:hypothetical protein V565_160230 [Rhizoctonia solani 123E]|uniref:Uncharacterized protein n=1 Tax=Rhizoctonia solani 123E TaxID=1423351 RepID=A0A074SBD8_9AGAM|nr:hypothetical protein V565_160230 [Rhizoctonia solani 123E]